MREPYSRLLDFILIEGTADYLQRVRYVIGRFLPRATAQAILSEIRRLGGRVVIVPMPGVGIQNAETAIVAPSTAQIQFSTAPFMHRRARDGTINVGPAWSADSVLCHEMVHAVRLLSGFDGTIPRDGGFSGEPEEFCATQVANIYLSERNEPLMANYLDREPLDARTFSFSEGQRDLLRRLADQQPPFFGRLAGIPAPFNPFALVRR